MKIIIALTGASGQVLGFRLYKELDIISGMNLTLIVSEQAKLVMEHENPELRVKLENIKHFREYDMDKALASTSFLPDAMVIIPCSMKTLAGVAAGYSSNLVIRAALNVLRTSKRLIIVPRETPLGVVDLENMVKIAKQGGIILPPVLTYYHEPQTIENMEDFVIGKVLDMLGINNSLYRRWI